MPVGYLAEDPNRANLDLGRIKALGPIEGLEQTIREQQVDTVIVTLPWAYHDSAFRHWQSMSCTLPRPPAHLRLPTGGSMRRLADGAP